MQLAVKIRQKQHKENRVKMKLHNGLKLLTTPKQISDQFNMNMESRTIYRSYMPTKTDPKLNKRPMLEAMDIYTYLKANGISIETLVGLVHARRATIDEIMGKLK